MAGVQDTRAAAQAGVTSTFAATQSGLNLLLRLRRRLNAEGGRLLVTGFQDQPTSLLHLTETYELFTDNSIGTTSGVL